MRTLAILRLLIPLMLAFSLLAAACAPQTPPPDTPTAPPAATQTPRPTSTPEATRTLNPTETETPAPEATHTPTAAPTIESELNDAVLFSHGFLSEWRYFISVSASKPIEGKYYALVGQKYREKEYPCTVSDPKYPNRLYCAGDLTRIDDWVPFKIIPVGSEQPVFEGRVSIEYPFFKED